jgi:signal peptidase I
VTLRLLLGLIVAVDAWRLARRHDPSRRRPNDWIVTLIFLGLWFGPRYVGTLGQFWPLGRTYHLPSGNMLPTLHVHDYVLAMPTRSPRLNDIVVFVPPDTYRGDKAMLVKRIVAVGGDTVAVEHGSLKRNGKIVDEPFVSEPIREDVPESKVAEGHFYMMGDNRNDSFDSRYWGTVPAENIKSRVVRVFWSEEWGQIGRKF